MGVGGGLAATAASHGLGNQRQERSIEDQRLGGLIGDDPSYGSGHSSTAGRVGQGAGASAVGTGTGSGSHSHSSGGLGAAGAGAGAAGGVAGLTAGQRDPSGHGAGAGDKGMLAQPQHATGLVGELERRAQASGTHVAGFGSQGNY